jgi:hypothetical protein
VNDAPAANGGKVPHSGPLFKPQLSALRVECCAHERRDFAVATNGRKVRTPDLGAAPQSPFLRGLPITFLGKPHEEYRAWLARVVAALLVGRKPDYVSYNFLHSQVAFQIVTTLLFLIVSFNETATTRPTAWAPKQGIP